MLDAYVGAYLSPELADELCAVVTDDNALFATVVVLMVAIHA